MIQADTAIGLIGSFEQAVWADMKAFDGTGSRRAAAQRLRRAFRELFRALVGRTPTADEVAAFERGEEASC